jgi:hypothetical protein
MGHGTWVKERNRNIGTGNWILAGGWLQASPRLTNSYRLKREAILFCASENDSFNQTKDGV